MLILKSIVTVDIVDNEAVKEDESDESDDIEVDKEDESDAIVNIEEADMTNIEEVDMTNTIEVDMTSIIEVDMTNTEETKVDIDLDETDLQNIDMSVFLRQSNRIYLIVH